MFFHFFPQCSDYLSEKNQSVLKEKGVFYLDREYEKVTTLVDCAECAFVEHSNGVSWCAIEHAYRDGKIPVQKPISCHLYPIRVKDFTEFAAVNYDKWDICDDACSLGKELQVPVYKFVKEALIRKFGEDWYMELEKVAEDLKSGK